jgi:hypothetical protein
LVGVSMKQVDKNEVDLLLRALAQRDRSAVGGVHDQPLTEHLDADELNTFAEDALPTAARARYTAHLADCSRCRQLVSQLVRVAGPRQRTDVITDQAGSSFWRRLGTIFSPAFLKYAVPALVLVSVIGIGVMIFRQQPSNDLVAQRAEAPANDPPALSGTLTSDSAGQKPQEAVVSQPSSSAVATSNTEQEKIDRQKREPGDTSSTVKNETAQVTTAPTEDQRAYAPEPASAPPPQPQPEQDSFKKDAEAVKEKSERPKAQSQEDRAEVAATSEQKRDEDTRGRGSGNIAQRAPKIGGLRRPEQVEQNAPTTAVAKGKKSGETRSVAGRQFRREADGWIDTAYDSSRSVVNIRRGSEQYRALIADEPGLKTIADSLSGPVTVVWKGRAYRIQ